METAQRGLAEDATPQKKEQAEEENGNKIQLWSHQQKAERGGSGGPISTDAEEWVHCQNGWLKCNRNQSSQSVVIAGLK